MHFKRDNLRNVSSGLKCPENEPYFSYGHVSDGVTCYGVADGTRKLHPDMCLNTAVDKARVPALIENTLELEAVRHQLK